MKKIGVFTGTFNPFTKGHLNILQQAEKIFDEVIIAIGDNPGKEKSEIDRLSTLKFQLPGKRVEKFSGFLVNYINDLRKEGDITIVRGLRNSSDLLYALNNLRVLNDLDPSIKSVFFVCDRKYEHISSTLVRQMESIQKGSASEYIVKPEMIEAPADEYTKKQLYEAFGKPKGLTFEGFYEEASKMLKDIKIKSDQSELFRKEYRKQHKLCPKCGSDKYSTTLVDYLLVTGEEDRYKDLNNCKCLDCGDKHTAHDRVETFKK
jgi:pantetheine-phosphate adenylyltransferase